MEMLKTVCMVVMVTAATAAWAAETAKEPPPTWPWPGATPPEQREAMMKRERVFAFRTTEQELKKVEQLAPDKPRAAPLKPRRLLVWGRLWTYMTNSLTEATIRILGKKTGAFEAVVSDDPQMLLPEKLKDFDAIFFLHLHENCPFLPPWEKIMPKEEQDAARQLDQRVKQSILRFVGEDGKGVGGIVGSIAAHQWGPVSWKEWGELMGAVCGGPYGGDFAIKVEDPGHPVAACLAGQDFRLSDTAYVPAPPYSRKKLRVLLSLDLAQTPDPTSPPKMAWLKSGVKRQTEYTGREADYALSWVKSYGKGRVFYVSLGVQRPAYSSPLFLQYLLAGIQFALGDLPGDTTPSDK